MEAMKTVKNHQMNFKWTKKIFQLFTLTNHLTHEMCQRKCGRVKGALSSLFFLLTRIITVSFRYLAFGIMEGFQFTRRSFLAAFVAAIGQSSAKCSSGLHGTHACNYRAAWLTWRSWAMSKLAVPVIPVQAIHVALFVTELERTAKERNLRFSIVVYTVKKKSVILQ